MVARWTLLFCSAVAPFLVESDDSVGTGRIVNGIPAEDGEFGYFGTLWRDMCTSEMPHPFPPN